MKEIFDKLKHSPIHNYILPGLTSHSPWPWGALPEANHPASATATLAPSEPQKVNLTALVDGLTVAEARALYHQLKLMFG